MEGQGAVLFLLSMFPSRYVERQAAPRTEPQPNRTQCKWKVYVEYAYDCLKDCSCLLRKEKKRRWDGSWVIYSLTPASPHPSSPSAVNLPAQGHNPLILS